jgi:hypothetical protein
MTPEVGSLDLNPSLPRSGGATTSEGAVPVSAFLVYMAALGTCGVLDHCGVDVCILSPVLYT